MAGLEPSDAPVLSPPQDQPKNEDRPAVDEIRKQTEQEQITVEEAQNLGFRTFFACKEYANKRFLVTPGKVATFPLQPGMPPGITPVGRRDGDIWAQFVNGVLVTDDADVIAFCLAHPQVCRDANDVRTPGWAALKELQVKLNNREVALPKDMDVDSMMYPEGVDQVVGDALATAGAPGPDGGVDATSQVADAITSGQKEIEIQAERAADSTRLAK